MPQDPKRHPFTRLTRCGWLDATPTGGGVGQWTVRLGARMLEALGEAT